MRSSFGSGLTARLRFAACKMPVKIDIRNVRGAGNAPRDERCHQRRYHIRPFPVLQNQHLHAEHRAGERRVQDPGEACRDAAGQQKLSRRHETPQRRELFSYNDGQSAADLQCGTDPAHRAARQIRQACADRDRRRDPIREPLLPAHVPEERIHAEVIVLPVLVVKEHDQNAGQRQREDQLLVIVEHVVARHRQPTEKNAGAAADYSAADARQDSCYQLF